ncbi:hypothetical protein XELAEV_18027889mg [Xenopus laevis]|uniref:Uncharacterized protein n=1 Tax=Xenopus laevis TaxID=8355 RepID=A0A974HK12_XENLA|nr:hypothetical protein XELAEV_18027889mg [Xenopus laevis]
MPFPLFQRSGFLDNRFAGPVIIKLYTCVLKGTIFPGKILFVMSMATFRGTSAPDLYFAIALIHNTKAAPSILNILSFSFESFIKSSFKKPFVFFFCLFIKIVIKTRSIGTRSISCQVPGASPKMYLNSCRQCRFRFL